MNQATPPSQTDTGQRWLLNFEAYERPYARILLDSLNVPSEDFARVSIGQMIGEVVRGSRFPVVLIPVQALEDLLDKDGKKIPKSERGKKIAYEDFDPNQQISSTPGSEGFVGSVVREAIRENMATYGKEKFFGPECGIEGMRVKKVKRICFVADNMGSGEQARDFIESFMRNRTLRSWRSYHLLEFSFVVLGSTDKARRLIHPSVKIVSALEAPTIYTADWDDHDRKKIVEICQKYGKAPKLGYKNSGGLFVPSISSVPNNLPNILRRADLPHGREEGNTWNPFFEGRVFPTGLRREIAGWSPGKDLPSLLHRLGDASLARLVSSREYSGAPAEMIALLALIYREPLLSESQIALRLHIPLHRVKELLRYLAETGTLTEGGRLTQEGVKLLHASKKFARGRAWPGVAEGVDWYYPRELR